MDNQNNKNKVICSKNNPILNRSRLMVLSSNHFTKPKSNILQKIQLQEIAAQNFRLKSKVNLLNDQNLKIKTRLTVAQRQKHKLINQVDFFSMERQQRPYSTKKLSKKIFNPRSSVKLTKTAQSAQLGKNKKIQNYMKDALRQSRQQKQKIQVQLTQLKRKVRYTRITELQIQNSQLLQETIRLSEQLSINKLNVNPYTEQVNQLRVLINAQIQKRKKLQKQLRKIITYKQDIFNYLQSSEQKTRKLQKQNIIQKKQHQQSIQKLREQLNKNRIQLFQKNQVKQPQNYHSKQVQNIKKLKLQNSDLKKQLANKLDQLKIVENQLSIIKANYKKNNQENLLDIKVTTNYKNMENRQILTNFNSDLILNVEDKSHLNNYQKNVLSNNIKPNINKQLEYYENKEKINKNIESKNNQKMFSDDSQLERIMNEQQSQQIQSEYKGKFQQDKISSQKYATTQRKKSQQDINKQNQKDNSLKQYSDQFVQNKEFSVKQQKYRSKIKNNQPQLQQQFINQGDYQSDQQVLFQKQQKQLNKKVKKMEQQNKSQKQSIKKQVKLLKASISYRLKAYRYTYQNFSQDIKNSGEKYFQLDTLKGFLSDQPFMLNQNQFKILLSEINVVKNKVNSEILTKKMKKFIGQVQLKSQQVQLQQIEKLKQKLIKNQKNLIKQLTKNVECITKKHLLPIMQNIGFTKEQIQSFISQSMLVSIDCSKINCQKTIQMLRFQNSQQA